MLNTPQFTCGHMLWPVLVPADRQSTVLATMVLWAKGVQLAQHNTVTTQATTNQLLLTVIPARSRAIPVVPVPSRPVCLVNPVWSRAIPCYPVPARSPVPSRPERSPHQSTIKRVLKIS